MVNKSIPAPLATLREDHLEHVRHALTSGQPERSALDGLPASLPGVDAERRPCVRARMRWTGQARLAEMGVVLPGLLRDADVLVAEHDIARRHHL